MIWYAAYGSNLLEERFLAYLRGGSVAGSTKAEHGARDPGDPVAAVPYMVARQLSFGYRSNRWQGGGVCFVDPVASPVSDTYGRAWLITVEQLEDVWAQENGQQTQSSSSENQKWSIDPDVLTADGSIERRGNYGRVELLGDLEGHPVATITCGQPPPLNTADPSYLRVVGLGLIETWGMGKLEAAEYLASRPGNQQSIDADQLAETLGSGRT